MSVGFARPDVSQLVFRLLDRSVHPELFDVYATWSTTRPEYSVTVRICEAGHVVSVRRGERTMTEIALPEEQPLPSGHCRLTKPIRGSRSSTIELASPGARFQIHHQVEEVEPEVYLNLHEEFLVDCGRVEIAHQFGSRNRFAPAPVSLVRVDAQKDHVLVHAYHTFPANCAVVRTQSLVEFAG